MATPPTRISQGRLICWWIFDQLKHLFYLIFSDKNARSLFLFLLLNLSFAVIEFMYGMWTNSLGLITDAFHMFFDCTGLLVGLAALVICMWKRNEKFSYGFVRAEVLSGFVNGLFLVFAALLILCHAIERAIKPPEIKPERLTLVSTIGLIVNLIGVYAFQQTHSHSHGGGRGHSDDHSHPHGDHSHSHPYSPSSQSPIIKGVLLHIIADTLGSVGVIISSLLVQHFGWMRADPICSIFIAILIMVSVFPLIKESVLIIMQRQPVPLDDVLPACYQKVMQITGVYSIQEPHFWTLCSENYVGALKLEVFTTADPKHIVKQTHKIFAAAGVRQLYVQLDFF